MKQLFMKCVTAVATCLLVVGCVAMSKTTDNIQETATATSFTPAHTLAVTAHPSATPPPPASIPSAPTWTPGVQLSPEEMQALLDEFSADHSGCRLPCWWDITPGETTWDELLAVFNEYSVPVEIKENSLTKEKSMTVNTEDNKIVFSSHDGLVQRIRITGSVDREPSTQWAVQESPSDYMTRFSLASVLSTYGVPSQVYTTGSGTGSHGPPGYYYLWVEYADRGILIGYSGYAVGSDSQYLICPENDGVSQIELWLYPQEKHPFADTMELRQVEFLGWSWDTWETVAEGASLEEFYEAFKGPEFQGCLHMLHSLHYEILRPTGFSPLPIAKKETWLSAMLQANEACELPCWWGITPGVTQLDEAQQIFLSQEGKPITILPWPSEIEAEYEVGVFANHNPVPLGYVLSHRLITQGNTVDCITVAADPPGWTSYSQQLTQDLKDYTLTAMLTRFGPPSKVDLFYHHPDCGETYWLYIVYDELGIMASYSGKVQRESETVTICPTTDDVRSIRLTLSTPGYFTNRKLVWRGWSPEIDALAFYRTYVDPAASACLELPEQTEYTCE